jgi:hypothetical protein
MMEKCTVIHDPGRARGRRHPAMDGPGSQVSQVATQGETARPLETTELMMAVFLDVERSGFGGDSSTRFSGEPRRAKAGEPPGSPAWTSPEASRRASPCGLHAVRLDRGAPISAVRHPSFDS